VSNQARDTRQPGYYWADNEIIDEYAAKIGPYALAVYHALCRHADKHGQSFPAIPTLAKNLKMSPRKAHDALKTLQAHGLIEIEERTKESGVRTSNCYTLIQVKKEKEAEATMHHMQGKDAPHAGSTMHHMHRKNTHIEQNPIEEETEAAANETPPTPSPPKAIDHPYVQAYREVFQRYPAKAQIAKIAKMVVTPPGITAFTCACESWLMKGFRPTNIDGILEWYRDGVPVYQNGRTRRSSTPVTPYQPPTQAEIDAAHSAPTIEV
jgi:DNA-binding transcriptional regulator YhcF (GntR family)